MKINQLILATAVLILASCSTDNTGNNDTSASTRSQAGGTATTPSRSADPKFMTGNTARTDDFTPAPPAAVSLSLKPGGEPVIAAPAPAPAPTPAR